MSSGGCDRCACGTLQKLYFVLTTVISLWLVDYTYKETVEFVKLDAV